MCIHRYVLAALLAVPCFAATDNDRQEIDRVARDFVVLSYQGRVATPLRGLDELQRQVRNLHRAHCVTVASVDLVQRQEGVDQAMVDATVALSKSGEYEIRPLRLSLVRSEGHWQVSAVDFPEEELIDRLIAARGDARSRLIGENERLLTPSLARALTRRVRLVLGARPFGADSADLIALTQDVAAASGSAALAALALAARSNLGGMKGETAAASALANEALAVAEKDGDPDALAFAWLIFGSDLAVPNRYAPAVVEAYQRGLEFAERGQDPLWHAMALHGLAGQAFVRGDYLRTRTFMDRSRELVQDAADPNLELWYELQIAMVYWGQADRAMTLHHLQRAAELARTCDSTLQAVVLEQLAETRLAAGQLDDAARLLAEARAHIRSPSSTLDLVIDEKSAELAARRGRFDEAECLTRQAAAGWQRAGYNLGPSFDNFIPLLAGAKRFRDVLRLALEQVPYGELRPTPAILQTMTAAAAAYHALGFDEQAQHLIEEAIEFRESLDGQISGGDEQKVRFGDAATATYELAAELAVARGDVRGALALVERGRGRVLYDIVHDTDAKFEPGDAPERRALAVQERALARMNLDLARAEAVSDNARAAELRERLDHARRDWQTLTDALRNRARRVAAPRSAPLTAVLRKLPAALAVVEYVVREESVSAFVVRSNRAGETTVTHHAIAIRRQDLERESSGLVTMIGARDFRYRDAARRLHALLVAPLEKELASAEALCIVPDEILWRVPFAALVDARGSFLVERRAIAYAPSVALYAAMTETAREKPRAAARILAVANPTLTEQRRHEITSHYRGMTFGALPDAEREAGAIQTLYAPRECLVLEREKATETRLRTEIASARLLHFATHAVFDDRDPMYSRLLLARGDAALDDGSLEAREIAALDLDADLVVLSACDTARGTIGGGEGVVGMAWSFFAAGARSMVATQWKVASEPTADLMIAFHRALRSRESEPSLKKARALRDAQLRLLRSAETRHPFYWAAFVLLGSAS